MATFSQAMLDLRTRVEENGDVLTVEMSELRDAYGRERLGVNVVAGIQKTLEQLGIGHIPARLTTSQENSVRLFKVKSPAGRLIRAVQRPGFSNDEAIRDAAAAEANAILDQVRELVSA